MCITLWPYGGTGIITEVIVPFGLQKLTWRLDGPKGMARVGELVQLKNRVVINPGDVPSNARYLGIHLYPDDTAEVTFSENLPDRTERGNEILKVKRSRNGKE